MEHSLMSLKKRLNDITPEKLQYIDKLVKQSSNMNIRIKCLQKIREINERLDEIDKLYSHSSK